MALQQERGGFLDAGHNGFWFSVTASNLKNAIVIFCIFFHCGTGKLFQANFPFRKTSLLMFFHESNTKIHENNSNPFFKSPLAHGFQAVLC